MYRFNEEYPKTNSTDYIPVAIGVNYRMIDKVNRLSDKGIIGIELVKKEWNSIHIYCLKKDLNRVIKYLEYDNPSSYEGSEYEFLDWLHDGLWDNFYDAEVEKRTLFHLLNCYRDKKVHSVVHKIMDHIDEYYHYFINCTNNDNWIYDLYNAAK